MHNHFPPVSPSALALFLLLAAAPLSAVACGDCNGDGSSPNIVDALRAFEILLGTSVAVTAGCDIDTTPGVGLGDAVGLSEIPAGLASACPFTSPPCTAVPAAQLVSLPPAHPRVGNFISVRFALDGGVVAALYATLAFDPLGLRLVSITHRRPEDSLIGVGSPLPFAIVDYFETSTRFEVNLEFEVLAPGCFPVTVDLLDAIDRGHCTHSLGTLQLEANCVCGDCNLDGVPGTILDALAAARIAVGLLVPVVEQLTTCDVDSNATITAVDSMLLAGNASGLAVMLTCP